MSAGYSALLARAAHDERRTWLDDGSGRRDVALLHAHR
jgi:hypothetical protein